MPLSRFLHRYPEFDDLKLYPSQVLLIVDMFSANSSTGDAYGELNYNGFVSFLLEGWAFPIMHQVSTLDFQTQA